MFVIKYENKDSKLVELEDRFRQLSLTFKMQQLDQLEEVILSDGALQVVGYEAIHAHLDKLDEELRQWYYCNC